MKRDFSLPTPRYEKLINTYLDQHYSRDTELSDSTLAKTLYEQYHHRYQYGYYLAMVEWWRDGFFDVLYSNDPNIKPYKSWLQWHDFEKSVKEYLGYEKTKKR